MAGQFNIPGLDLTTMINQQPTVARGSKAFIQKGPSIQAGPLQNIFGSEAPRVEFYSNYKPNLSERAEEANRAIEAWQKKQFGNIAKTAGKSKEAIKAGIRYAKPIAQLGGKALGVGADIANVGQLIASDDPFDKWAAGIGLAGSALQKASIPLASSVVGAPLVPWALGIGTAMQYGGAAAPYVKDWVENKNRQQEANRDLERQLLEEEIKRRGLL